MEKTFEIPPVPDHKLIGRVASGSYGEVWLAKSTTGALRAVKFIHRERFEDKRPYQRELTGIQKYEPLSREHENLVDILHVAEDKKTGCFFYIMELADSLNGRFSSQPGDGIGEECSSVTSISGYTPRTLQSELSRDAPMDLSRCLIAGISMARGLAFLHSHGLVHRDIKPSNIIFVKGKAKLADVGLIADTASARSHVGTDGYIPPEGAGKEPADIFALGKVLYEMCTGLDRTNFPEIPKDLPFRPSKSAVVELNCVFLRACDPVQSERYPSADALLKDLEFLSSGKSLVQRRQFQRRAKSIAIFTFSLLVILGTLLSVTLNTPNLSHVASFSNPAVASWGPSVLVQADSDPAKELVFPLFPKLLTFGSTGLLEHQTDIKVSRGSKFSLGLVHDVNQDGIDDFFVNWVEGTNLFIRALTPTEFSFAEFHETGTVGPDSQSYIDPIEIIQLEKNRKGLVAAIGTGFGKKPRSIVCFDLETRVRIWKQDVAPNHGGQVFVDLDSDGILDVIAGTDSPCNGNHLADGSDDFHSYIYGISSYGELLWRYEAGDEYVCAHPFLADTDGDGKNEILARVFAGPDFRKEKKEPEIGKIIRLSNQGVLSHEAIIGSFITATVAVDFDANGTKEILVADRRGRVHLLDSQLRVIRTVQLTSGLYDWSFQKFLEPVDLDGDGELEIVVKSLEQQPISNPNNGHPSLPRSSIEFHNASILVISRNLDLVAEHRIFEYSTESPNFDVRVSDLYGDGQPKILLLQQDVTVLDYRRSMLRRLISSIF